LLLVQYQPRNQTIMSGLYEFERIIIFVERARTLAIVTGAGFGGKKRRQPWRG